VRIRTPLVVAVALVALLGSGSRAYADITAFLGVTPTPSTRSARGIAVGLGLVIVGFEIEFSSTAEKTGSGTSGAPSLTTGMFNGYVQMPVAIKRMRFYGTAGGGIYRERLGSVQETNVGINVGGGVKVNLVGPLRLRLDYRVFQLRGHPLHAQSQRLYAGLNLTF
jgi:opacity protein-like surface antigen